MVTTLADVLPAVAGSVGVPVRATPLDLPPTRDEELIVQMSHMIRMIITGARTLAGHPPRD